MFLIRLYSYKRQISFLLLFLFGLEIINPMQMKALTGGPSQLEYESFEPAGATEMVNLATGDFVYNIPLMDVDGYPINMAYHGGIGMEQEASWVGLGWNLNVGSINRGMRGLPDDFKGEIIEEDINIKPTKDDGVNLGLGFEVFGIPISGNSSPFGVGGSANLGISYNNYKGVGVELSVGVTGNIAASVFGNSSGYSGGLGLKISNQDGTDFTMNVSQGSAIALGFGYSKGTSWSRSWNSRQGMTSDTYSGSESKGMSLLGLGFMEGTGSSINMIPNTAYLPNAEYSTKFNGITGQLSVGGELFGVYLYGMVRGHRFEQSLASNKYIRGAYGYLNLDQADAHALTDFNRDKDGTYYLECPKLPFASLTYDVFNANAQGLNELYRPYRNDFGAVHDPYTTGGGSANDHGLELGLMPNLFEIGYNGFSVNTNNTSGAWWSGISSSQANYNVYTPYTNTNSNYENTYFKAMDELFVEDMSFYNTVAKDQLASFTLQGIGGTPNAILSNALNSPAGGSYNGNHRTKKETRSNTLSYLTVGEAKDLSVTNSSTITANQKRLVSYPVSTFSYTSQGDLDPDVSGSLFYDRDFGFPNVNHHISEVNVLKDDGALYQYGIAVYNNEMKESIFNVSGNTVTNDDIVNYNSTDNSISNAKGLDNFFNSKKLPPFAHTYLLTQLTSSDYVDITGNGLSNDDYGDYTKFNYSQTSTNYMWRNVTGNNTALFDPQLRADARDDKAAISNGSKAVWYLHSIETKNYIAEFYMSDRQDGFGVGPTGAVLTNANNTLKKLDKIVLKSKKDLNTPIKTVHFKYDYDLCLGTPNSTASGQGKLTLKSVYFTYGTSSKGVFNPYEFIYADANHDGIMDSGLNPSYDRRWMDRWGVYRTALGGFTQHNRDFPYSVQDKATADQNAGVWALSSVITPARSKINVYYESDSYAYIQDKRPAQMVSIYGFSKNNPGVGVDVPNSSSITNELYDVSNPYDPHNWMVVDLSLMNGGGLEAPTLTAGTTSFKNDILPGTNQNGKDQLYFRAYVQLGNNAPEDEMVPGYAEFDRGSSFLINTHTVSLANGNTLYKYACIKLKDVDIEDNSNFAGGDNCNPVSKASWQITRLLHPHIAYPGSQPGNNGLAALAGLWGSLTEALTFNQKNKRLRRKKMSRIMDIGLPSIVRLNVSPDKEKFGGGHRVSKIEVTDNWNSMVSSEASTTYGQTYDYTILENGVSKSSGVTSYEPLFGGEENSLREPVDYSVARIAAPDDAHFIERPIGESFYPPATVIYRKVTVKNLERSNGLALITQNIGRTEYEFYTAKEFPIYSAMDGMQSHIYLPDPVGDLFNTSLETAAYLSQGFILKLNNMHGKLKSILTFQQGNANPISGMRYYYKTKPDGTLDNQISVMKADGSVMNNQLMGQHVEVVSDFRSSSSTTFGNSTSGNLNCFVIYVPFPIPIPIPSVFTGASSETRDFYSATLNKVVTQNGILYKVETINDYSTSTSENILWDEETQDVILARTTTNFRDYDYTYTVPAHWKYKGMSASYKNIGLCFKNVVTTSSGAITLSNGLLNSGDEVALYYVDPTTNAIKGIYKDHLWINDISTTSTPSLMLIDRNGLVCSTSGNNVFATPNAPSGTNNFILKVIKSGYKNLLGEAMEQIMFSSNPLTGSAITGTANIIEASASEFTDTWNASCFTPVSCGAFASTNPYITAEKGNWQEVRSYNYMGRRQEKNATGVMDVRKDGTFEKYKYFHKYSGGWKTVYDNTRSDYVSTAPFDTWVLNGEITKMSPVGNILETKDAINRYAGALYGYNQTLKTAAAVNAKHREISNEHFEDYGFPNFCREKRLFSSVMAPGTITVTNTTAHTGRYSLSIAPGAKATLEFNVSSPDCETVYGYNNYVSVPGNTGGGGTGGGTGSSTVQTTRSYPPVTSNCVNCVNRFAPQGGLPIPQKYTISVWFKESAMNASGTYTAVACKLAMWGNPSSVLAPKAVSAVVNGWQKFDYELSIPPNAAGSIVVEFENLSGANTLYVDDFRMQVYNATMETYVYDPKSLRLWATLDDRNFATFYEYSNEGVLVRTKRETEKGIVTVQESRTSFKKK